MSDALSSYMADTIEVDQWNVKMHPVNQSVILWVSWLGGKSVIPLKKSIFEESFVWCSLSARVIVSFQAFAADDVVADFSSEKDAMKQRDKPKDIDLTLPGWGDWGGGGLKVSKRKRKR